MVCYGIFWSGQYSDDGFIILSIKKKWLFSNSYNQRNRRKKANQSKNLNLGISSKHDSKRQPSNRVFSHDVTAAILVSQNN